jgi:hypothetical protein
LFAWSSAVAVAVSVVAVDTADVVNESVGEVNCRLNSGKRLRVDAIENALQLAAINKIKIHDFVVVIFAAKCIEQKMKLVLVVIVAQSMSKS